MDKSIMLHIRTEESLQKYISIIHKEEGYQELEVSQEVKCLIRKFLECNWKVYLTTLENIDIDNKKWNRVYYVNEDKRIDFTIEELNKNIDIIMIRNVGSVEANFDKLQKYLTLLINEYEGKVLNNAKAMKKGMTKHYLMEIDPEYLKNIGFITIPTESFPTSVTMEEIASKYKNLEKYLIKPITGELSNSLKTLDSIDEQFFRYKETKVGGWIVQPIQECIWNGEYQLVFIDKELTYCQQKQYENKDGENLPQQKSRKISKYSPSQTEVNNAKNLIEYISKLYNLHIDICRIDYIKDEQENMILLEFEMVNPGFFIGYMKEDDQDIKNIVDKLVQYCEKIK